jgi:hypothetical protein
LKNSVNPNLEIDWDFFCEIYACYQIIPTIFFILRQNINTNEIAMIQKQIIIKNGDTMFQKKTNINFT